MQHRTETLIFMTDPICSWCWGMVPELRKLQAAFSERLDFKLKCAGLQVGSRKPLTPQHTRDLVRLWQRVAETTGQTFAFSLPDDTSFIYHSELACRALEVMRRLTGEEPFEYYYQLQQAFYIHCRNIGDADVLCDIAGQHGITASAFHDLIESEEVISTTRAGFDWCKDRAISALPTLFLDRGEGPELVCGGYATAEFLVPDINARLTTH